MKSLYILIQENKNKNCLHMIKIISITDRSDKIDYIRVQNLWKDKINKKIHQFRLRIYKTKE